jgi:hypothetical protein
VTALCLLDVAVPAALIVDSTENALHASPEMLLWLIKNKLAPTFPAGRLLVVLLRITTFPGA